MDLPPQVFPDPTIGKSTDGNRHQSISEVTSPVESLTAGSPGRPGGRRQKRRSSSITCETADDHHDKNDDEIAESAGKRRKTGPGSRTVANLTEEQRLKKRANGRAPFRYAPS
jgi:hypothetical protein